MSRLRAALERLNPALPPEAITAAVDELTRDRSAMSLEAANRAAFDENLTHYKAEIPQLFWFNALLIASNGTANPADRVEIAATSELREAPYWLRLGYR